jgi:hypothetical protein
MLEISAATSSARSQTSHQSSLDTKSQPDGGAATSGAPPKEKVRLPEDDHTDERLAANATLIALGRINEALLRVKAKNQALQADAPDSGSKGQDQTVLLAAKIKEKIARVSEVADALYLRG